MSASGGSLTRSMQQLVEIARPVFQSLTFLGAVRSTLWRRPSSIDRIGSPTSEFKGSSRGCRGSSDRNRPGHDRLHLALAYLDVVASIRRRCPSLPDIFFSSRDDQRLRQGLWVAYSAVRCNTLKTAQAAGALYRTAEYVAESRSSPVNCDESRLSDPPCFMHLFT